MRAFFVTGTGTDIGKTYVATGIIRAARKAGRKASAIKPIISGYDAGQAASSDAGLMLTAMDKAPDHASVCAIAPWRYEAPLSPDMAAAREGRVISLTQVLTFCRYAISNAPNIMLVEGVGGTMVPLDGYHTVRDWIASLHLPALLVTGSYLGAISHALTSAESLQTRGILIAGIVISESAGSPIRPEEIARLLPKFLPRIPVHIIHRTLNDLEFEKLAWALDQ